MRHGPAGYNRGCKCEVCTAANSARKRRNRAPRQALSRKHTTSPEPGPSNAFAPGATRFVAYLPPDLAHGTASAYGYHQCRCATCTAAETVRRVARMRSA